MSPHFESPPPDPSSAASPPPPEPIDLTRPTPRPPRSASRSARVRILNRRREYLARHPSYMALAADNELADPLLYDSLIRRFQTPAERESDGRRRGYGHVLESSLLRSEAAASSNSATNSSINAAAAGVARLRIAASYVGEAAASSPSSSPSPSPSPSSPTDPDKEAATITTTTTNFSVDAAIDDAPPADRAEARERWLDFLRDRFVAGRDDDFDYGPVDGDDDLDAQERRDAEEAWFDLEEPSWGGGDGDHDDDMDGGGGTADGAATRERRGETGIQDY
ncbi:hypothetical protein RB595_010688 [Gaeumannomyces hyphopodioides]